MSDDFNTEENVSDGKIVDSSAVEVTETKTSRPDVTAQGGYVNVGSSGTNSANRYERENTYGSYQEDRMTGAAYQGGGYQRESQGAYGRPHYTSYQYTNNMGAGAHIPNSSNGGNKKK